VGRRQGSGRSQSGAAYMAVVALFISVGAYRGLRGRTRGEPASEDTKALAWNSLRQAPAVGVDQPASGGNSHADGGIATGVDDPTRNQQGDVGSVNLPTAIQVLGALLAPPAAAVGLVLYLATRRQEALLLYFGIHPSLLDYTVQEYLLRSADVLAVALLPAITLALVAVAVHSWVQRQPTTGLAALMLRWGSAILQLAGLVIFAIAMVSFLGIRPLLPAHVIPPGITVGVALGAYGGVVKRRLRSSEQHEQVWIPWARGILYSGLLFIGVFLTTEEVAERLGRGRAELLSEALNQQRPGVVLYSDRRLFISGPGVNESQLNPSESDGYAYRYDGLRLLVRSGERLVLLPSGWTVDDGRVHLVRDDGGIRVELSPPGR
jgi:hypothetical protein